MSNKEKQDRKYDCVEMFYWADSYLKNIDKSFKEVTSLNKNDEVYINNLQGEIEGNLKWLKLYINKLKNFSDKLEEIKYSDDVKEIKR